MGEIEGISNYRKFIFSLSEALTKRDLASLTYLLCDTLTAREIENINDPKDLFGNLERRCMLGRDNFHILEDLFTEIHRQDLVKKVKDFQRKQITERGFVSSNETQLTDQRTGSFKFQGPRRWDPVRANNQCLVSTSLDDNRSPEIDPEIKGVQGVLSPLSTLISLSLDAYEKVWKRLDKRPEGKNKGDFRTVAVEFGFEEEEIWELEKELTTSGSGSPSRQLLQALEARRPQLTVFEFIIVMKKPNIDRNDIVDILKDYLFE